MGGLQGRGFTMISRMLYFASGLKEKSDEHDYHKEDFLKSSHPNFIVLDLQNRLRDISSMFDKSLLGKTTGFCQLLCCMKGIVASSLRVHALALEGASPGVGAVRDLRDATVPEEIC